MKFVTAIAILMVSAVPIAVVADDRKHERGSSVRGRAPNHTSPRNLTPKGDTNGVSHQDDTCEEEDSCEGVSKGGPPDSKGGEPPDDEESEEPGNPGNGPPWACGIHISPPGHERRSERAQANLENLPASCDESDEITIELPNGTSKTFRKGRSVPAEHNGQLDIPAFWAGQDDTGSFFNYIRANTGVVAGSFTDLETHEVYQFGIDFEGNDIVRITPTAEFSPESDPEDDGLESRVLLRGLVDVPDFDATSRNLQADTVIDVMVLWTENAECAASGLGPGCSLTPITHKGMKAIIYLAIAESNNAFINSGIHATLNLVHFYRESFYESTFSVSLNQLVSKTDNMLDNVHTLRDQYKADVVAMIIDSPEDSCGLAKLGPAEALMFSVTKWSCATGHYSFVHEIGHNFGLQHDRGVKDACGGSGYNYGYRDPNANFRSILAYDCDYETPTTPWDELNCDLSIATAQNCDRVQVFSNTENLYNNKDIGSADANNARYFNEKKDLVADYRGTPLVNRGWNPSYPLGRCQGDCDRDSHCKLGLKCFLRSNLTPVPGCTGSGTNHMDYCITPPLLNLGWGPSYPLNACEGDCDYDWHCAPGLKCFHRHDYTPVPGCTGSGTRAMDYCFVPPNCPGPCSANTRCMFPAYVQPGYDHCPTNDCFPRDCVFDGQLWNPLHSIGCLLRPGDTLSIGEGITYKGYEFGLSPVEGILTFFEHMDMSIPETTVWSGPATKGKYLHFGLDGILRVLGEDEALIWEAGNCMMENNVNVDEVNDDSIVIMTNEGQVKLVKNGVMIWSVNLDGKVFDLCADNKYLLSEK